MGLDDLKEIDDFQDFKSFIKTFILEDEELFRCIYFCYSDPFDEDNCPMPDRRLSIFDGSKIQQRDGDNAIENIHGVVLFRPKNDNVISSEIPVILVDFYSASISGFSSFNNLFIRFKIICKGVNIQELSNGLSRSATIARLIDINLNQARIKGSLIKRESYKPIPLNEENSGWQSIYSCTGFSYDYLNNKNIQKQLRGDS